MAAAIGTNATQLGRYLAGTRPTSDALAQMAVGLGVSADFLLFGEREDSILSDNGAFSEEAGVSSKLPVYVREMVNIPPHFYQTLPLERLKLLVLTFRLTTGRTIKEMEEALKAETTESARDAPQSENAQTKS